LAAAGEEEEEEEEEERHQWLSVLIIVVFRDGLLTHSDGGGTRGTCGSHDERSGGLWQDEGLGKDWDQAP